MAKSRILVIDPDPKSSKLLTSILRAADYAVLTAVNGQSGIQTAEAAVPVVIILEMVLQGEDGISVCNQIKKNPVLKCVPVIGMTASADGRYQEKAFRAGAESFLTKPISIPSLLQLVQLAEHSAQRKPAPADAQPAARSARRDTDEPGARRDHRFKAALPVKCLIDPETKVPREIVGETANVSFGGVHIWLPQWVTLGTVLSLRLELPTGTITVEGQVSWKDEQPTGPGLHGHGIELSRFKDDSDMLKYKVYLNELAAGSASDGLEFLDISEETRGQIFEVIESLMKESEAMPTYDKSIRRSFTCDKCGEFFNLADSEVRPVLEDPRYRPVQTGDLFYYDHGTCVGTVVYAVEGPFQPWSGKDKR
ncbi:MAG: response regulator [candidate division NC10 bacterium]|nr:response regulator [candidate division NC10 bacterium]MCH7897009.1 response regulator [candidate division NC10 bacterium]MCZ6551731.1 response regulator [candidate division NC10 bacterium]